MRRARLIFGALAAVCGFGPLAAQEPTGTVRGRVTEEASQQPLQGVTVRIGSHGALSGPDGRYVITGVPAGRDTVRARMIGYRAVAQTVTVEAGRAIDVDFRLSQQAVSLAEIVVTTVPAARFGLAFCEASGPCLVRTEGNEPELIEAAAANAERVGAGHAFVLLLRGAYPINLLNAVKQCPEVCQVFCATANPVQVLVAGNQQGRGIVGVIDGAPPRGREDATAREERRAFLRRIGYKR